MKKFEQSTEARSKRIQAAKKATLTRTLGQNVDFDFPSDVIRLDLTYHTKCQIKDKSLSWFAERQANVEPVYCVFSLWYGIQRFFISDSDSIKRLYELQLSRRTLRKSELIKYRFASAQEIETLTGINPEKFDEFFYADVKTA
jgi:hypothetical protein